jgi:c-di-AMP phosphodiesterase-like protein
MDRMRQEAPELEDKIINGEAALEIIDDKDLMIVVDNHKPSLTEAPELLEKTNKVVVIDHHRRGAEFIKDPVLTYLEPYASSTSELVTEVLTYMSAETNLTKFEAEAMLAGITVDTKNFSFQTGVRTFEAASVLKRAGADSTVVKQLFRDDFSTFINKAEVVRSAKMVFDKIAIGRLEVTNDDSILIAAQAANELLNINDVEASFVLSKLDDKIHISGRSLGNISVQLILEKLGGGGHLTSAGAQIEKLSMNDAEKLLIDIIGKFLKEGEKK